MALKNRYIHCLAVILLALFSMLAWTAEESEGELKSPDLNYDEVDPKDWGIQNGCIRINQIKSFTYVSPKTAKIDVGRDKSVIMTFRNECTGFDVRGVLYETRTGELCARFDHVTVLGYRTVCQIESIEPFLGLDQPDQQEE